MLIGKMTGGQYTNMQTDVTYRKSMESAASHCIAVAVAAAKSAEGTLEYLIAEEDEYCFSCTTDNNE